MQGVDWSGPPYDWGREVVDLELGAHQGTEARGLGPNYLAESVDLLREQGAVLHIAVGLLPTLTTATWTTLSWDTVDREVGSLFNPAAPTLLTIARQGWYTVEVHVTFDLNGTGARGVRLIDHTGNSLAQTISPASAVADPTAMSEHCQRFFLAGETVRAQVFQRSGGNLALIQSNGMLPGLSIASDNTGL